MKSLVAVAELRYAGKTVLPGQPFEADDKEAVLLKAIGKAREGAPANKTDLPPATHKKEELVATPLADRGQYLRTDMRAEDGQTGAEASLPSSRRGRPPKRRASEDSEE